MSTTTKTKPCRKATRTKRGRPAADDYPMPFRELPLRLQDAALESFRRSGCHYYSWDSEYIQENLAEILTYEFGVEPVYENYKNKLGNTCRGNPKIYWDQYNFVEFEVDDFDIHEVLKHGGDEEALTKEHGTCYYKPEARELAGLWATVAVLESALGMDFQASYRLKPGEYESERVEWQWERDDGPEYYPEETPGSEDYQVAARLFERIDEALKDYYEAAYSRLRQCIEDEEEWHSSDEYLRDTLENNDCYTFDEEGDLA